MFGITKLGVERRETEAKKKKPLVLRRFNPRLIIFSFNEISWPIKQTLVCHWQVVELSACTCVGRTVAPCAGGQWQWQCQIILGWNSSMVENTLRHHFHCEIVATILCIVFKWQWRSSSTFIRNTIWILRNIGDSGRAPMCACVVLCVCVSTAYRQFVSKV